VGQVKKVTRRVLAMGAALTIFTMLPQFSSADNTQFGSTQSTFYVIATDGAGSDTSIGALVGTVASRLQKVLDASLSPQKIWVIPRLPWGPGDLYSACVNDPDKASASGPKVLGGMILDTTNTYASNSSNDFYVFWTRNWAKVTTHVQLITCAPTTPTIVWMSNDLNGYGSRNGFPFVPIAGVATYFSSNSSTAKGVAIGASVVGSTSTLVIPPVDAADAQEEAVMRITNDIITKLMQRCKGSSGDLASICQALSFATQ
jgi:hypothetical protein